MSRTCSTTCRNPNLASLEDFGICVRVDALGCTSWGGAGSVAAGAEDAKVRGGVEGAGTAEVGSVAGASCFRSCCQRALEGDASGASTLASCADATLIGFGRDDACTVESSALFNDSPSGTCGSFDELCSLERGESLADRVLDDDDLSESREKSRRGVLLFSSCGRTITGGGLDLFVCVVTISFCKPVHTSDVLNPIPHSWYALITRSNTLPLVHKNEPLLTFELTVNSSKNLRAPFRENVFGGHTTCKAAKIIGPPCNPGARGTWGVGCAAAWKAMWAMLGNG